MRILIAAIVAIFALGTLNAQAAQGRVGCKAPSYACSAKAHHADVKTAKKARHHAKHYGGRKHHAKAVHGNKRYAKSSARKATRVAARSSGRSYSGSQLSGKASYYWQPQRVASGGWFNPNAMTAAHKSLPFGTRVSVTNLNNGRSVVVRINDRGPYIAGRIIDLSKAAAYQIGMQKSGVVPVRVTVLGRG
ncbi:MAG: septal ring lytic transglycosylase RlpA family protein [Hyphomicrobiaceae bacterium]|nr:septal ring lytic transglycosylase RlpA family protein [Hyphomicrobiaceae bacterium]